MHELDEKQIALVCQDVESAGINFSHLETDLVDHVCCNIEHYMNQGISFNQAYARVKEEFGIKGLRQIQQETLMLIDKNYRIMKNSMKTIGVLAMSLMAFGALFKIFHWPGASIMLTVSFFFTALVFFPSMLYVMYKEVNKKQHGLIYFASFIGGLLFMLGVLFKIMHWPGAHKMFIVGIAFIAYLVLPLLLSARLKQLRHNKFFLWLGFISLMVFISGIMFKVQHWPGATVQLMLGSILLIFFTLPYYYKLEVKNSSKIKVDFIFGIIALTYFIVFTFLISIRDPKAIPIEFAYQSNSYIQSSEYFMNENQMLLNDISNENLHAFHIQSDNLCKQIEDLKVTIVQLNSDINSEEAKRRVNAKHTVIYSQQSINFLLSENNQYSPLPALEANINAYINEVNKIIPDSVYSTLNIKQVFGIKQNIRNINSNYFGWESINFKNQITATILAKLSLWQYNINLLENKAIRNSNPKNI